MQITTRIDDSCLAMFVLDQEPAEVGNRKRKRRLHTKYWHQRICSKVVEETVKRIPYNNSGMICWYGRRLKGFRFCVDCTQSTHDYSQLTVSSRACTHWIVCPSLFVFMLTCSSLCVRQHIC